MFLRPDAKHWSPIPFRRFNLHENRRRLRPAELLSKLKGRSERPVCPPEPICVSALRFGASSVLGAGSYPLYRVSRPGQYSPIAADLLPTDSKTCSTATSTGDPGT
jgi:hypothetical protein